MTPRGRHTPAPMLIGAALLAACVATVDDVDEDVAATRGVFELETGMCFDVPEGVDPLLLVEVVVIDCDEPHDHEVYAHFDLEATFPMFPGAATIESVAAERCARSFEEYVGEAYTASDLFARFIMPTAESWERGDRTAACYLFDPDGQRTGTARDRHR